MDEDDFGAPARPIADRVDFGRTASDYRTFRAGFPPEFFRAIVERGWAVPHGRAVDLGTGTGTVARGLAAAGLSVIGIDPAPALLREAAAMDREIGVTVDYRVGRAEETGLRDGSADLVTAGQCWHWFDRPRAATEIRRILAPGGRIIVAHFDWLPIGANVVSATEDLILEFNPGWAMAGGVGIHPEWLRDLAEAAFGNLETFSFDVLVPYTHAAWRGRIRASAGVKASLPAEAVERFDRALAGLLIDRFPDEPLAVPHRVWAVGAIRM